MLYAFRHTNRTIFNRPPTFYGWTDHRAVAEAALFALKRDKRDAGYYLDEVTNEQEIEDFEYCFTVPDVYDLVGSFYDYIIMYNDDVVSDFVSESDGCILFATA